MLRKIIIVSCLCLPFISSSKKKKPVPPKVALAASIDYHQPGAPMPPFTIVKTDGNTLTEKTFTSDGNLILMMFNPNCEHCEDMTKALEDNTALFKKTKVVMIAAPNMGGYIGNFITSFKIDNYPQIQIGLDASKTIDKLYNYYSLPQLNIYNKERKLIKMFSGITAIDSLRQYID